MEKQKKRAGRRKENRVKAAEMAANVARRTGYKYDDTTAICRAFLKEIFNQIENGRCIKLGFVGSIDARWVKPHRVGKNGSMMKNGCYVLRFKFTEAMKRKVRQLNEGDFDYPYVDMYEDGIVTENGIQRAKREEEEFLKNS